MLGGNFDSSYVGDLIGAYRGLVGIPKGKKLYGRARNRWGIKGKNVYLEEFTKTQGRE